MIHPPALRPGARIALVSPAGPLAEGAIERAEARVRAWGWEPAVGEHARGRRGYLAASDAERAADLNRAIHDPRTDAVWCLRGGYGTMRILERIDWDAWTARPLPLVGFSDNTALHLALQRRGIVSLHGPHAAAELPPFTAELLHRLLTSPEPIGRLPLPFGAPRPETVRGGRAAGPLVGGNLALLAATVGTPYALRAEGSLLFLEDVGEPAYRVDRMLTQLRLAGALEGVAGVLVGDFASPPEEAAALRDIVAEELASLGVPVALGFPFGHIAASWTLPLGVPARLDADALTLELLGAALAR